MLTGKVKPTNKPQIAIVGAFDRHNYGDLLFPLIVEYAAKHFGYEGQCQSYGVIASDLSRYGAQPTLALRALFDRRRSAPALVVVAGGEVLPATFGKIIGYLAPAPLDRSVARMTRWLGPRWSARVASKLTGIPSDLPFVFSGDEFGVKVPVSYNAVGCSHLDTAASFSASVLRSKLRSSYFVSVRDELSRAKLREIGVANVSLAPDSAVLVSTLYPKAVLAQRHSEAVAALQRRFPQGYVCVQSAWRYVHYRLESVVEAVAALQRAVQLPVVLFTIGLATGHSDDETVRAVATRLGSPERFASLSSASVVDIASTIAHSRLYAGTSLHGAVTALSYGVPHIGLEAETVTKLAAFLATWSVPHAHRVSPYASLASAALELLPHDSNAWSSHRAQLNQLAFENLQRVLGPVVNASGEPSRQRVAAAANA